ncbi:MAG: DUF4325 domain-containing protein [Planctomycetota bacterium]
MSLNKEKHEAIKQFIINNVIEHPNDIGKITAEKFGISRQGVNYHIKKLTAENILEFEGVRKSTKYKLKETEHTFKLPVTPDMEEHRVWADKIRPVLPILKENIFGICAYGFQEMLNNVIFHSQSKDVQLTVTYDALKIKFWIIDSGIGIFNKIQKDFNLNNPHDAILELAKGKLTSDPEHHTGQGIFFASRMFDEFAILSGSVCFLRDQGSDWLFERKKGPDSGTSVNMIINRDSTTTTVSIFDQYTSIDEGGFSKTIVPVELMQYEGELLISRSQARRLIARFEKFREVMLDFKGIKSIGQAFADEVFRVFRNEHPNVHLMEINANEDVQKMIKHAQAEEKSNERQ